MKSSKFAVHQFSAAIAAGDGASNGMIFTRRLLRELGFESDIFAFMIAPELAADVCAPDRFVDGDDVVLLVHHTLGHEHGPWLERLRARKVLVYHNITPAHFFPADHELHALSLKGREMLRDWQARGVFAGAIAASPYNAAELAELGFERVRTLPLLVDVERMLDAPWDRATAVAHEDRFTVLFVGRLAPNKCQHDLLALMAALLPRLDRPAELVLAGGVSSREYEARLAADIDRLGLRGYVHLVGKVEQPVLLALYRAADVFVCASEHEGFGMPLLEAMLFDVPVVAWDSSNVGATVGCGGVVCRDKDPERLAALVALVAREPGLRRAMLQGQRENLRAYGRTRLVRELAGFLAELGVEPPRLPGDEADFVAARTLDWRIEGPFDSSYSLALVNREFARGLIAAGDRVALHSTEGRGDFDPDRAYLAANPDLAAAWERGCAAGFATVATRNCYPPRVSAMPGLDRWLLSYGWEESAFPQEWVEAFNRTLTGITAMSKYVARVLRDNGVGVPIAVVGLGADHVLRTPADPRPLRALPDDGRFTFLHVSSGFPRKGLDVLLRVWARAFSRDDPVRLVVKTFPNPHNTFVADLESWRAAHPGAAPVVHLDADLDDGAVRALYERAGALVGVSRGEGFGLPLAEAMLLGVPVIASAHGGQRDFCDDETAWLVDYRYAHAKSHFGLFGSVWAEPDEDSYVAQLRAAFAQSEARAARAAAAKRRIETEFTWEAAVARLRAARSALAVPMIRDEPGRVALVTTWNSRCGIADYARAQASAFPRERIRVFANDDADAAPDPDVAVDRCWTSGAADPLDRLYDALVRWDAEVVLLQFNFGFFDLPALSAMLARLAERGVRCHVVLHATRNANWCGVEKSLRDAKDGLSRCARLMVHAVDDLNRLKDFGLDANALLVPHGIPAFDDDASRRARARRAAGYGDHEIVIASGGFLLPNKGYLELVEAFERLRGDELRLRLRLQTPEYPAEASRAYRAEVERRIADSRWRDDIVLAADFLGERDALDALGLADRLVYPTGPSGESSSASVRWGLASGRPVAVTPSPIFDDVRAVVFTLPGDRPDALAEGLARWLATPDGHETERRRWTGAHRWPAVSGRLWQVLCCAETA